MEKLAGSARLTVYITHFIQGWLVCLVPVPIYRTRTTYSEDSSKGEIKVGDAQMKFGATKRFTMQHFTRAERLCL